LLRSFAAVADSGSFTAAAELVARTQSAVSVQIKRLEEILGHKVFERTSRSLALTRAGETLLGYARRILELNDESVRRIAEPPVAGTISLGITSISCPPSCRASWRDSPRHIRACGSRCAWGSRASCASSWPPAR